MKKYNNLGELLTDYRKHYKLSQPQLAAMLDVDGKTVGRWERLTSMVKPDKEKELVEKLFIPYQVIRNLNSDHPLAVYYDLKTRNYSLTGVMTKLTGASWYKSDFPPEDERIHLLSKDTDVDFVNDIQEIRKNEKLIYAELIKMSARLLPDLNLVLHDQSGFYAGHLIVLPLKYSIYEKIRNREIRNNQLSAADLSGSFTEKPLIFYFYSIYSDSVDNSYYLVNRMLSYFKEKKFREYLFTGITYRKFQVDILQEMGLKVIWQNEPEHGQEIGATLLEGNFDMFLFGKMM